MLVLGVAGHAVGGRSSSRDEAIVDALASYIKGKGGTIETSHRVRSLSELPRARAYLSSTFRRATSPRFAGDALPLWYRSKLEAFKHGPGCFKIDYALSGPVPWKAAACKGAGHGSLGEERSKSICTSESTMAGGEVAERPNYSSAQQSLFEKARAPAGKHTGWGLPRASPEARTAAT